MGAAQASAHRRKRVRHVPHFFEDNFVQGRATPQHRAKRFELQGMAGVVDVFAGAGEMHKFAGFFQLRVTGLELGL